MEPECGEVINPFLQVPQLVVLGLFDVLEELRVGGLTQDAYLVPALQGDQVPGVVEQALWRGAHLAQGANPRQLAHVRVATEAQALLHLLAFC